MALGTFTAQLRSFETNSKRKLEAVMRQSAQEMTNLASTPQPSVKQTGGSFEIGRVPVDTGYLRNSQITGINGGSGGQGPDAAASVIASAPLGSTISVGWTAAYAKTIDQGNAHIQARRFLDYHLPKWQAIVGRIAEKLRRRKTP